MQYCFGRGHLGLCGVVVELQLSSYAMGWCVGFEGGFRVVLRGFEVAIACEVCCRNCAELG